MTRVQAVFFLDSTLLLGMCALESVSFTGLRLHEWLAITMVALILVHLLLAWTWIAASSRKLTAPKYGRTRVNYFLNACLFASAVTVMFSGLMISDVVLPRLGVASLAGNTRWLGLHNTASTIVLIFAGLHLAINWEWSVAAARKCFRLL